MMDDELAEAKQIYDQTLATLKAKGHILVHKNMPQMSGQLQWISELGQRVDSMMNQFKRIDHA